MCTAVFVDCGTSPYNCLSTRDAVHSVIPLENLVFAVLNGWVISYSGGRKDW